MTQNDNEWLNDYKTFLSSNQDHVPIDLNTKLFVKMEKLINPPAWIVFLKIMAIHLVTGFLSLSVCHQFGLNPFNTEKSLSDWFMNVGGHHFCMLGCGILFVAVSIFAAGLFLTLEEVKSLKRTEFLQNLALGLISLGFFAAFGAELALGFGSLWLLGGLIGGFFATSLTWKIRLYN